MADRERRALGILLLSGSFERAHHALMLAAGAAAIDRRVVLFATNSGLLALCRDWSKLDGSDRDAVLQARGVAGFDALRDTLAALEVRLLACEAGMRAIELAPDALMDGVEPAGIPSFLEAVGSGQMLSI